MNLLEIRHLLKQVFTNNGYPELGLDFENHLACISDKLAGLSEIDAEIFSEKLAPLDFIRRHQPTSRVSIQQYISTLRAQDGHEQLECMLRLKPPEPVPASERLRYERFAGQTCVRSQD
jgi:hypothetical protein